MCYAPWLVLICMMQTLLAPLSPFPQTLPQSQSSPFLLEISADLCFVIIIFLLFFIILPPRDSEQLNLVLSLSLFWNFMYMRFFYATVCRWGFIHFGCCEVIYKSILLQMIISQWNCWVIGCACSQFWGDNGKEFSTVFAPAYAPAVEESSLVPHPHFQLVLSDFFNVCQSGEYVMAPHCGFTTHSPYFQWGWAPFHVLRSHFNFLFC